MLLAHPFKYQDEEKGRGLSAETAVFAGNSGARPSAVMFCLCCDTESLSRACH